MAKTGRSRGYRSVATVVTLGLLPAVLLAAVVPARSEQNARSSHESAAVYAVQVGAFRDPANAERRFAMVDSFIDGARVFRGLVGTEATYLVIAGAFADRSSAKQQAALLRSFGFETYLRQLSDAEARVVGLRPTRAARAAATAVTPKSPAENAMDFLQGVICRPPLCDPNVTRRP